MRSDPIFLKRLFEVVTPEEVQRIIDLNDSTDLTPIDEQEIELFFVKIASSLRDSLFDTIVQVCNHFDFDLNLILANTKILEKITAEKKGKAEMEEFFV